MGGRSGDYTARVGASQVLQLDDTNEGCSNTARSHHPPVTAYCIWNEQHGVGVCIPQPGTDLQLTDVMLFQLQGYNAQKASFSRTIQVKQIGHALLHLDKYNEDYLITIPALHIEGLIYGNPFVELNNKTYIVSSSGYVARVDYSGKGWVSGKKNSFDAVLYKNGQEKDPLYTIDGQWNESFTIRKGSKKHGGVIDSYAASLNKTTPLQIAPLEQQGELEAHRAWKKVIDAIIKGDMDTTNYEKSKIENAQRELRKKEQAEGKTWERRYFTKLESDPLFDKLAKPIGEKIEADRTGGIWRFDVNKAKQHMKPPLQAQPELK